MQKNKSIYSIHVYLNDIIQWGFMIELHKNFINIVKRIFQGLIKSPKKKLAFNSKKGFLMLLRKDTQFMRLMEENME